MIRAKYINIALKALRSKDLSFIARQPVKLLGLAASLAAGKRLASPLIATLIPTYRCNSSCGKCDKGPLPGNVPEMSTGELLKIIGQLSDLKVSAIDFTGGEPLLRGDILELISKASSSRMFTHLSTNGWLLTPELSGRLIASGVDSVNISLDSPDPLSVDASTGVSGSFDRIINGIRNIIAARNKCKAATEIGVVAVLGESNSGEIEKLCGLLEGLGVDGLTLNPLHVFPAPLTNNSAYWDKNRRHREYLRIKKNRPILENSRGYLDLLPLFWNNRPLPVMCVAGYSHIIIDAYRRVFPCFPWLKMGGGHALLGDSVRDTINSAQYSGICGAALKCRSCYWNCYIEMSLPFSVRFFSR